MPFSIIYIIKLVMGSTMLKNQENMIPMKLLFSNSKIYFYKVFGRRKYSEYCFKLISLLRATYSIRIKYYFWKRIKDRGHFFNLYKPILSANPSFIDHLKEGIATCLYFLINVQYMLFISFLQ